MATKVFRAAALVFSFLCGTVGVSRAQDTTWAPPTPSQGKFDWIQLVSGEWLGGELKAMRDGSLEFDSDKLDLLKLDWSDVKGLLGEYQPARLQQHPFPSPGNGADAL